MMQTIKEKVQRNKKKILLSIIGVVITVASITTYTLATTVTAKVVGFGDKATSGLRTSELCEVVTTGFSNNATLEYVYENDSYKGNVYTYQYSNQVLGIPNNFISIRKAFPICLPKFTVKDAKYFALADTGAVDTKLKITVKDVNSKSSTYNQSASCTYYSFASADLGKDISSNTYAMYVGDRKNIKYTLAQGGLMHVYCDNSNVSNCTLSVNQSIANSGHQAVSMSKSGAEYWLDAREPGSAVVDVSISKTADCDYHSGMTGSGKMYIGIFLKPNISAKLFNLSLTQNTMKGVTYTLNGESITCRQNDQVITFGNNPFYGKLTPGTEYELVMSTPVSGKTVYCYDTASTSNSCLLHENYNAPEVEFYKDVVETSVTYNEPAKEPAFNSRPGYDFLGWYDNPYYIGTNYAISPVTVDELTLYAKWKPRVYNTQIELTLDGQPYLDGTVSFGQNGTQKYKLTYKGSSTDGASAVYEAKNVPYCAYQYDAGTGINYGYDIYLDGKETGFGYRMSGKESSGENISFSLCCLTASVTLQENDAQWKGQVVTLKNGDTVYTLEDKNNTGTYSKVFIFDLADYNEENPLSEGPYIVYVNEERMDDWNEAGTGLESRMLKISQELSGNSLLAKYVHIKADIEKDSEDWTDATVVLVQKDKDNKDWNLYTVGWSGTSFEKDVYLNNKGTYDLYVKNVYSGEDTGVDIGADNYTTNLYYYSVSYMDKKDTYQTQVIKAGERATKPVNPYKVGWSFYGWYDREYTQDTKNDAVKYFKDGNKTAPINDTLTMHAAWEAPGISIGDYVKCDVNGTQSGTGTYYRLQNLSIYGFPGGENSPIYTAVIETTSSAEQIKILDNTKMNDTYSIDGDELSYKRIYGKTDGSNSTNYLTIYFDGGWKQDDVMKFLAEKIVIKPTTNLANENHSHTVNISIFGSTVAMN